MSKKWNSLLIMSLLINMLFLSMTCIFIYQKGGLDYIITNIPFANKTANTSDKEAPYFIDRKTLFNHLEITDNSIVLIGDSLIDNNEWNEALDNSSIKNRGIQGDTSSGVYTRIDAISNNKPSSIFLMVGINDLQNGVENDLVIDNYKKIVDKMSKDAPSTNIYITSILPVNKSKYQENVGGNDVDKINKNVQMVNVQLEKLTNLKNVKYIDLYSKLASEEELNSQYTSDGLHLNGDGYDIWVKLIKEYIE